MTDYAELIDRLSGKYRVGPTNESGEPEFGYRQFPAPLVQLEAATALETLLRERDEAREERETIRAGGAILAEARKAQEVALDRLTAENARLREALKYAEPLVEKWCHSQGNNTEFHAETLSPIRQALGEPND